MDNIGTVVVLGVLILALLVLQVVHIIIVFRREDSLIGLSDKEFEDKYLKSHRIENSSFRRDNISSHLTSSRTLMQSDKDNYSSSQGVKAVPIRIPVKKSDRKEEQQFRQALEEIDCDNNSLTSDVLDRKNNIKVGVEIDSAVSNGNLSVTGSSIEKLCIKLKPLQNTEDDELE